MTRGRSGNFAYVSEGDDSEHPAVDPSLQLSWPSILGEVLAAEGAERTAHEVRAAERRKSDSLERLYAEYDYLAQLAAGLDLTKCLNKFTPDLSTQLEQSPSWGAAVAAWRKAIAVSRKGAERVMEQTLRHTIGAYDPAAVLSMRLRHSLKGMPTAATEPSLGVLDIPRPDLAELLDQVRNRIWQRTEAVTMAALLQDPEWKSSMIAFTGDDTGGDQSGHLIRLIREVAIYRDRWGISDSPLPLGPVPADYEWEQLGQRERLTEAIEDARSRSNAVQPAASAMNLPRPPQGVLTSAGWQL
jgi:hypothetical protein